MSDFRDFCQIEAIFERSKNIKLSEHKQIKKFPEIYFADIFEKQIIYEEYPDLDHLL